MLSLAWGYLPGQLGEVPHGNIEPIFAIGGFIKLSPGEIKILKGVGLGPHSEKLGGSKCDLYKDKDGNVFEMLKGAKGEPEALGINIRDIMKKWGGGKRFR